jgi:hypothetical protein
LDERISLEPAREGIRLLGGPGRKLLGPPADFFEDSGGADHVEYLAFRDGVEDAARHDLAETFSIAPVEPRQEQDDWEGRPALTKVGHYGFSEIGPRSREIQEIIDQLERDPHVAAELEQALGEVEGGGLEQSR